MQPGHRRDCQGQPGTRDRRAGRPDGAPDRRHHDPVPASEPKQGPRRAGAAGPGGQAGLCRAGKARAGVPGQPAPLPGYRGGSPGRREWDARGGSDLRARQIHPRPRRGPDHGHVHGGSALHRRVERLRRAARRAGGHRVGDQPPPPGVHRGEAEDGDAGPRAWLFSHPGPHGASTAGSRPRRVLVLHGHRGPTLGPLLRDVHQRGDPSRDPGEPGPLAPVRGKDRGPGTAVLPLDRGQGGPIPGPDPPPGVRGARGPGYRRGLSQRRVLLPSGRGAGAVSADHTRPGAACYRPTRLRGRIRLPSSHPALPQPHDEAAGRPLPGGSDQRDLRIRGGRGAGDRGRHQRGPAPAGQGTDDPEPRGGIHRRAGG